MKGRLNGDKGRMKVRLLDWGCAVDRCKKMQKEMARLQEMREEQKKLLEKNDLEKVEKCLKEIDEGYEREMERLETATLTLWKQKEEMERLIGKLAENEREYLELRYAKGYGFEYIEEKMYMSRATIFRLQDRILEKLLELEKETP